MKKSTKIVLAIALCLCLISGIFASLFMTSFNTVKVQDMKVVVDEGYEINAQVYIPKKASEENKLPLIVLSHGSYNNFDHQETSSYDEVFLIVSFRSGSAGFPRRRTQTQRVIDL